MLLLKVISTVCILSTLTLVSYAISTAEYNEMNFQLSINSQLAELRDEQKLQKKDETVMALDIQDLKKDGLEMASDIQFFKAEQDRQRDLIEDLFKRSYLRNCADANTTGISDIIIPNFSSQPFTVFCDAETRGGGWTIILRRIDGSVDFNRKWNAYKKGFGDLGGEFFLGLEKIHALTSERSQELLVLLEDIGGTEAFETYEEFAIGDEDEQYVLHKVGKANGTAKDSLSYHHGMKFTTVDRDNDGPDGNCAEQNTGGWWYDNCFKSHLTGTYNDNTKGKGVNWSDFRDLTISLKTAVMLIRPRIAV